jgi:predicted RNA binding protein YcfA (HicA-like mRNA interferase family)
MPRKIRELIRDLEAAGFVNLGGKGDHRNFVHPKVAKAAAPDLALCPTLGLGR